jgi:hypothetical protein
VKVASKLRLAADNPDQIPQQSRNKPDDQKILFVKNNPTGTMLVYALIARVI